jgi:hypothetical protein
LGPDDDLSNVAIEDDAFDELQAVVNKTMKLKTKKENISTEKVRINFIIISLQKKNLDVSFKKFRH